ncbi:MAG TPA: hypothetical protein VH158_09755 [Gemmatimonadales bacterium]|jgi:DNA-binding MarR family transcriptional regulator|nr:hypothetical protein [Gemmatimonadales bacterium]
MPQPAPNHADEPVRQGFVGYVYIGALKWRVMLRLQLEAGAWRGQLWFAEAGGMEVKDTEELVGRSPEELLQHARSLPAEDLIRRFRASYGERRRCFALRAVTDELIEHVRALNRAAARAAAQQLDGPRAVQEVARHQEHMHLLVEGMGAIAGREGRSGR